MNTQKKAMNKIAEISKQELSSIERVEFATNIKDIVDSIDLLSKEMKGGLDYMSEYDFKVNGAIKNLKASISAIIKKAPILRTGDREMAKIKEIIAQGKDLGVDMSKNNDVQRLERRVEDIREMHKDIQKLIKDAEAIIKKL